MLFSAYMWVHFCSVVGGLSKQSIYGIIDLYRVLALGLFRLVKHKLKLKPGRKTLNRGARGEGARGRAAGAARAAGGGAPTTHHSLETRNARTVQWRQWRHPYTL